MYIDDRRHLRMTGSVSDCRVRHVAFVRLYNLLHVRLDVGDVFNQSWLKHNQILRD